MRLSEFTERVLLYRVDPEWLGNGFYPLGYGGKVCDHSSPTIYKTP